MIEDQNIFVPLLVLIIKGIIVIAVFKKLLK